MLCHLSLFSSFYRWKLFFQLNSSIGSKFEKKMSSISTDEAKKLAAEYAVTTWFKELPKTRRYHVGIGSGSTIVYAVAKLAEIVKVQSLKIDCVPSSFQSRQLICEHNLQLASLDVSPALDIVIDGADEIDSNFNMIKGGGGCLLQEKILFHFSTIRIVLVDYTKVSKVLGDTWKKGVPIEVVPHAVVPISRAIENSFSGKVNLRMAVQKAGPVVTDNGNLLIDWIFPESPTWDWKLINDELLAVPGVVETGLFINYRPFVYLGMENGNVEERFLGKNQKTEAFKNLLSG